MASGTGTSGSTAWSNSAFARGSTSKQSRATTAERSTPTFASCAPRNRTTARPARKSGCDGRMGASFARRPPAGSTSSWRTRRRSASFSICSASCRRKGATSHRSRANPTRPSVFEKHPNAEGIRKREFASAMERLLMAGRILVETRRAGFAANFEAGSSHLRRPKNEPFELASDAVQTAFGRLQTGCALTPPYTPGGV